VSTLAATRAADLRKPIIHSLVSWRCLRGGARSKSVITVYEAPSLERWPLSVHFV
jgi:hypothetical protein